MGDEKKEKVLHTRIPESLEGEIKRRASGLGVSVSNLVRNVLQNAFEMVDDIVADSANVARSARDAAAPIAGARGASSSPARVLGWHELVLELNAICNRCNEILPKGTRAAVSVLDGPGPRIIRCIACTQGADDANADE